MQIAYTESQAAAPYREMFAQQRTDLSSVLEKRNVPASKIQAVAESGYILWHEKVFPPGASGPAVEVVHDGFYGKKWGYGFIPLNEFLYCLEHLPPHKVNPGSAPSYTVGSLREAEDILNRPRHAIFKQPSRMCFRGQTKEYFATRPYGNPNKRDQLAASD